MNIGCVALTDVCAPPRVAGGQAIDTLHISKARSEEEMKIDAEKWQPNAMLI